MVYLDTDCILALVKEEDWLKQDVMDFIRGKKNLNTSVITVLECRMVLLRKEEVDIALKVEEIIKEYGINLYPLTENILKKSNELMLQYGFIQTFDAVHAATAIVYQQKMVSTDHIFPKVESLLVDNPRSS